MSYQKEIASPLLNWYQQFQRPLPWRKSADPYLIWITEIIFQQTRIEQGMEYFHRFTEAFPNVHALADASDDQVMKLWEGLGYYNRARNLLHTARVISHEREGHFPADYSDWLSMKGVGEYTAAIIASVCYGEVRAAVDGNVLRVLSRYFAETIPVDSGPGKRHFQILANQIIDPKDPGDFNQAMMDLGATICTPRHPDCPSCPIRKACQSSILNRQHEFPVKVGKKNIRLRHLNYFRLEAPDGIFVKRRTANDIWPDLYEYPLIEGDFKEHEIMDKFRTLTSLTLQKLPPPTKLTHQLTHQKLNISLYKVAVPQDTSIKGYQKKSPNEIKNLSFPKPLTKFT